jgi:copper chaperone
MMRALAAPLLLASALGCNGSSRASAPASGEAAQPSTKTAPVANGASSSATSSEVQLATLTIEGMVCQGCAEAAKQTLEGVAGVVSAQTDFQLGTATIAFDPSKTNVDALAAAIEGVDQDAAPAFRVTARSVEQSARL